MGLCRKRGKGNVLWPMRVALTGMDKSPDPFAVAGVLGKKKTIQRLNYAIEQNLKYFALLCCILLSVIFCFPALFPASTIDELNKNIENKKNLMKQNQEEMEKLPTKK